MVYRLDGFAYPESLVTEQAFTFSVFFFFFSAGQDKLEAGVERELRIRATVCVEATEVLLKKPDLKNSELPQINRHKRCFISLDSKVLFE